ncbi:ABC transporter substrate-binding protein [Sphingobium sp. CCH11-B1]|jgi:iron complex transport system substrate-binding protein|uniref:ABC transporter substrate-binding protein n=1 Tax=Sphingobium sp. CCH11-B1 TaxID=1768781 RepID=UPI0008367E48|nr:ABC transporter substrate-binding protein [Sphingobium sp. CCH11-B1]MEA3389871.1 ABC transporter substrate-binding protein [Pseudomonadota bacterium]
MKRFPPVPARQIMASLMLLLCGGATGATLPVDGERARAAVPRRIVSLNLCADQLVLALADRSQIAGLTHNATDVEMSAAARQAQGLPILGGSAEEVLAADPDLIVGMSPQRHPAAAALDPARYAVVDLTSAETYGTIVASIRQVARAVGHPARGEALIAGMDADLARIGRARPGLVAAYYQRRGYMTGTDTLIDELMQRVGLTNLASKIDKPPLSQMSLEEMVAARPDYLIMESATDQVADQGTEMLHHPALAGIKRISIPQAWTVCGGPAYVKAARALAMAR